MRATKWRLISLTSYFLILSSICIGCSEMQVKFPRDPGGGLLSSSEACLYDFDADGFWYVIFLRCDRLESATHRHEAGHHLMLRSGDLLFYSRCSGRGEAIDILGRTFSLKDGPVFLVTASDQQTHITQLPARSRKFDGADLHARSAALVGLISEPRVQAFLSEAAQARIIEDERSQRQAGQKMP